MTQHTALQTQMLVKKLGGWEGEGAPDARAEIALQRTENWEEQIPTLKTMKDNTQQVYVPCDPMESPS